MNSYPVEFLAHPQPLMFVAGLSPTARRRAGSTATPSPAAALSPAAGLSPNPNPGLSPGGMPTTLPVPSSPSPASTAVSPSFDTHALPLMSPEVEAAPLPRPVDPKDAEFDTLMSDLRAVFTPLSAPAPAWLPETQRRDFRVLLVDNGVRLPLRKMPGPDGRPGGDDAHSPLSPLTPSSPLHPDGVIAPVWVRKHAELVPSVFVLFLRLYEAPGPERGESSLGAEVLANAEREAEREADEALVREIADRRRRLGERGIKLTVVLMASAATLESPGLDQRLSQLRRQSSLSAKASLFVLTPVPAVELPDFVRSLQDALYDSALEYYNAHGKKVRRKRGRVAGQSTSPPPQAGRPRAASIAARPLGPQGWTVRYDFKAGWFAEMRGELDLARRHYEDCWNELARMFSSTTTLPPRTKRWAEAKVLTDCVALKICKLLMYEGAGSRVLVPFFVHLRRFGELSRGWGIGEDTFEFWSWVARQYRILAEVLEIGLANGFEVPPLPDPTYPPPPPVQTTLDDPLPNSSSNPLHLLHPPAFYYYTAACSTLERKIRFDAAHAAEQHGTIAAAPGFANEKKVDHGALIIELLTRAYNLLKESNEEDSRLALYIAFKMAEVYNKAGQYDLALKSLGTIEDRFATDHWEPMVRQLRAIEYECAQATGNVETAARLLIDMMGPGSGVEEADRAGLQEDFTSVLATTAPAGSEPIVLDLGEDALLEARSGFRSLEASAGGNVAFQVVVAPPAGVDVAQLQFTSVRIGFSDNRGDVVVRNGGNSRLVDTGTLSPGPAETPLSAPLQWAAGGRLVISGQVTGDVVEVEVTDVTVTLVHGAWTFELRLPLQRLKEWTTDSHSFVPLGGIFPYVAFSPRPYSVALEVDHPPAAFVSEALPITLKVSASDPLDASLGVLVSVLLQPGPEPDGATVQLGEETSESLIKDHPLQLVDGAAELILALTSPHAGTKMVDVSISVKNDDDETAVAEVVKTGVVPVLAPFSCAPTLSRSGATASLSAVLGVQGPRAVIVTGLEMVSAVEGVTLAGSSLSLAPPSEQRWDHTTAFALAARFKLDAAVQRTSPPGPIALINVHWRPADDTEADKHEHTATIALPYLPAVPPEPFITASLTAPAVVRAQEPFSATLRVANAHPAHPAYVAVHGDTADAFVWSGPRGARVGPVPAGGALDVRIDAVAVGSAGWIGMPHLSVAHGEGADRREVKVAQAAERAPWTVLVQP